jgi:menaquinone-dependent protoporphyrinogen oxidase
MPTSSAIAVVFATHHGHTRVIAEHIADACKARGHEVTLTDLSRGQVAALDRCDAALLISPIHIEKHDPKLVALARSERSRLDAIPSALVTISLTQTAAQDPSRSPADRAQATAALDKVVERFVADSGWRPREVCRVAGRLAYREYGFFTRFVMRRISKKSGGSTDTSRNHEYTDWGALNRFVASFLDSLERSAHTVPPSAVNLRG